MSPTVDLESRISELESTIESLRSEKSADKPRMGRRRLFRLAAAAAGGGVAAPLLLSQTASASTGNNLVMGCLNTANTQTTVKQDQDTNSNQTAFVVAAVGSNNTGIPGTTSPLRAVGANNGEGVFGYCPGVQGYGAYGTSNTGYGVVGYSATGIDIWASGTGRLLQDPTGGTGAPSYSGQGEQVRDDDGALYIGLGGSQWAPALLGGDGVGIYENVSTTQHSLSNSDGVTWAALGIFVDITAPFRCNALATGNADLWTANSGVNQDIGIFISGGSFGAVPGTLVAWKESGGFAGTFSPNAAFVQGIIRPKLAAGTTYRVQLRWKANHNAPGATIYAGAGPIGGAFSPTRLVVQLLPA